MSSLKPLVDADYLIYRVGFAVDSAPEPEPVEYALSTAKHALANIWEKFPNPERRIFLSGKGNFREDIATIQIYKGNRDPANKPRYYSEIKDYMFTYHGAEPVNGMEAEDACGIEQYAHKDKSTVIVGVDKDLMCIPGWHYNPVKDELMYQTLDDANYWFWCQVLSGDRTDHIPGIEGLGEAKKGVISPRITRLMQPYRADWNAMAEVVLKQYRTQYGTDAERAMDEVAKLIWILRKPGETYDGSSI